MPTEGTSEEVPHPRDGLVPAAQSLRQLAVRHAAPPTASRPPSTCGRVPARARDVGPFLQVNTQDHPPPLHAADAAAQHPGDLLVGHGAQTVRLRLGSRVCRVSAKAVLQLARRCCTEAVVRPNRRATLGSDMVPSNRSSSGVQAPAGDSGECPACGGAQPMVVRERPSLFASASSDAVPSSRSSFGVQGRRSTVEPDAQPAAPRCHRAVLAAVSLATSSSVRVPNSVLRAASRRAARAARGRTSRADAFRPRPGAGPTFLPARGWHAAPGLLHRLGQQPLLLFRPGAAGEEHDPQLPAASLDGGNRAPDLPGHLGIRQPAQQPVLRLSPSNTRGAS